MGEKGFKMTITADMIAASILGEEPEAEQMETAEAPIEASEETGETAQAESTEQVEEASETTAPEDKQVPLKAVQDERRKRQDAERRLAEYEARMSTPQPVAAPVDKPKPDQFEDYDDYVSALSEFNARRIFAAEAENNRNLTRADMAQREEARINQKAVQDAEKAVVKYSDFYEVAATVQLPKNSLDAIYQSDLGTEITYYLGKNPAELDRISDMTPSRQIMELGKLEVKLATKAANPEVKRTRQPTAVESAGTGFQAPAINLTKLQEEARETGDWQKYLEARGVL